MRTTRPFLQTAAAVSAVLCLAATAACFGGGGGAASAADCGTDVPGVTGEEVEVGLIYPDSGSLANSFNAARAGIDARFGLLNAEGGVHGRQVVYRWRDDQASPTENLSVSEDLVEREGVFAVLEATLAAAGGAQYLDDRNIPVVGLAVEDIWGKHDNMFSFANSFSGEGGVDTFGKFVQGQGGSRAMVIRDPSGGATAFNLAGQLAASLRAAGVRLDEADVVDYTKGASSPDRIVRLLVGEDIDTLVGALNTEQFAEIVVAARRAGVPLKVVLSGNGVTENLVASYGTEVAGMTSFATYIPFQSESTALDAYRQAVREHAPQLENPDQTLALTAYIAADMFIRGLIEAGECPTRETFISRLRAVDGYDAGGLINPTNFAEFGKINLCYSFVRVNASGTGLEVAEQNFCGNRL